MVRILFSTFLTSLFFLMGSCKTQTVSGGRSSSTLPVTKTPENKIVYIFFEIEKLPSGSEKVTHVDTKITEGIMKSGSIDNKPNVAGNLLITMLGTGGNILEERIIEDPLNPVMEVYAEEGVSKTKMTLKKADFSVRFNQKGEVSEVTVEKITTNAKNKLITLKL